MATNVLLIKQGNMYTEDISNALNTNTTLFEVPPMCVLDELLNDFSNNGITVSDISNIGFIYHNKFGRHFPFLNKNTIKNMNGIDKIDYVLDTSFKNDVKFDKDNATYDAEFAFGNLENLARDPSRNVPFIENGYFSKEACNLFHALDNSCNIHLITCELHEDDLTKYIEQTDLSNAKQNTIYFSEGNTGNNIYSNPPCDWILEKSININAPNTVLDISSDVVDVFFKTTPSNSSLLLNAGEILLTGLNNTTQNITQTYINNNITTIRNVGITLNSANINIVEDLTLPNDIIFIIDNSGNNTVKFEGNFKTIDIDNFTGTNLYSGLTNMLAGSSLRIQNLSIHSTLDIDFYAGAFVGQNIFGFPKLKQTVSIDRCNFKGNTIFDEGGGICGFAVGYEGNNRIMNCSSHVTDIFDNGAGIAGQQCFFYTEQSNIEHCSSYGNVGNGGGGIIGPISGRYGTLHIKQCFSKGNIGDFAGGIAGAVVAGFGSLTIENCYSNSETIGVASGGIVGDGCGFASGFINPISVPKPNGEIIIKNCYSTANTSRNGTGGIVGPLLSEFGKTTIIENCFSNVNLNTNGGGIIGPACGENMTTKLDVNNCFSLGDLSANCGGIIGPYSLKGIYDVSINNCYVGGDISNSTTTNALAGGILGASYGDISMNINIDNCYVTSEIDISCGGIAPEDICGNTVNVINCYTTDSGQPIINNVIRGNFDVELLNNGNLDLSLNIPFNGYIPDTFGVKEYPLLISFRDNTVWIPDTYTNYDLLPQFAIIIGPLPRDDKFVCDTISNQLKYKKKININTDNKTLRFGSLLLTNVTYKSIQTKVPGDGSSRISMLKSKLRKSYNCNGV